MHQGAVIVVMPKRHAGMNHTRLVFRTADSDFPASALQGVKVLVDEGTMIQRQMCRLLHVEESLLRNGLLLNQPPTTPLPCYSRAQLSMIGHGIYFRVLDNRLRRTRCRMPRPKSRVIWANLVSCPSSVNVPNPIPVWRTRRCTGLTYQH